ncbi:hypothetical protein [Nostoc sp. C052]|uniref:hypothetical protein n=1 Tax=Nostoc sp. C052 TaxID=2576902 RepID=UPI0015C2E4F4|nr:hypothetical protein [Nostoc sp. C052]
MEPETVEPETVEPETVEPETVEPETVEPETVEPETVEPIPHNLFAINSTTYRKENRANVRQLVEQKTDMVAAWCSDYNFFDTSRSIFVEQLPSNEYLQVVAASFPVLRFDSSAEVKWSSRSDRPFF